MQKLFLLFRRKYYFVIAFLILFIALYPKFPFENVSGTFVAIRLEDIFIAIALIFWFILNIKQIKKWIRLDIFKSFSLFWVIGGLSLISGLYITFTVTAHLGLLHWVRRIEYMSLFFLGATMVKNEKQVRFLTKFLLLGTFFVVAYGFGQIYLSFPVISTTNREFSKGLILYLTNGARVNSTFGGHYDLAVYLSIILIILASLFFFYKNYLIKIVLFILGAISFILLGLTAARASFVAAIAGIALIFWINHKRFLLILLFLAVVGSVGVIPELRHRFVATLTVNLLNGGGPKYNPPPGTITDFTPLNQIPDNLRAKVIADRQNRAAGLVTSTSGQIYKDTVPGEPVNSTELGVYRSFGIRLNVEWPRAINSLLRNPFLGTGYSSITLATDNDYLRSLGETGLLGTASLILIFFIILKNSYRFQKKATGYEKFFVMSMFISTIVVLLTGTFIDVLEASKVAEIYWIFMGINWAVLTGYQINQNEDN